MNPSEGEELLALHIRAEKLPAPVREFRFLPTRRYRVDFCWPTPDQMLAVEVEGGIWTGGRHSRGGKAFIADINKYNALTLAGYRLLRFATDQVRDGTAIATIKEALT